MRLWTFQSNDFSLTSGEIDVTRSPYYESVPNLVQAYDGLAKWLGLPKYEVVWCHVRDDFTLEHWEGYKLWELEVSDDQILAIVDSFIWCRIIDKPSIPSSLRAQWRRDAPHDHTRGNYLDRKSTEYYAQSPPAGGWWSQLSSDVSAEAPSALLKHPIPEDWIINK
jgi:hypothetical protein